MAHIDVGDGRLRQKLSPTSIKSYIIIKTFSCFKPFQNRPGASQLKDDIFLQQILSLDDIYHND